MPPLDPDSLVADGLPATRPERDRLFVQLYSWLLDTARRVVRSRIYRRDAADPAIADVVGDLYADWDRVLDRYTPTAGTFRAYLTTILRRKLIDRWRRERVRANPDRTTTEPDVLNRVPARDKSNDAVADLARLRAAVAALPPGQRELIELRFFENLTFQEIAARKGRSLASVYREIKGVTERLGEHLA